MARAHPASTDGVSVTSSPALIHAAWTTALVAVCLALCTIHSRNRKHSFSLRRRGSSSSRSSRAESINCCSGGTGASAGATPAAKVSPTPTDTPNKANNADPPRGGTDAGGGGPVTVIDVGTHGPIAPVFLPPDPIPPRRSLSTKHIRSVAERLGRIRSMRRGSAHQAAAVEDDDVFVGRLQRGGARHTADDDDRAAVLWTKTIILGERCRVPSDDAADATVPWKSYRPRQPRSVPVTRSNSFAGVSACNRADGQY